jgi:predicted transcriptional regulator
MNDFHVRHLPVVEDGIFLGLLSEDEVLNFVAPESSVKDNNPVLITKFVSTEQHLYDVMKLVVDADLSVIPVLSKDGKYKGIITVENLVKQLVDSGSITHPGGILVLEMNPRDYSLAEIARLIESENAAILSSLITSPYGSAMIELTLKLNKEDLKHVVATLERFGYTITSSFYESDYLDSLRDRYESFIRYLNV